MYKLITLLVLVLGVSGAVGGPLGESGAGIGLDEANHGFDDTVRVWVSGADADQILLRLGVDPTSLTRGEGGVVIASLSQAQRATLARIKGLQYH